MSNKQKRISYLMVLILHIGLILTSFGGEKMLPITIGGGISIVFLTAAIVFGEHLIKKENDFVLLAIVIAYSLLFISSTYTFVMFTIFVFKIIPNIIILLVILCMMTTITIGFHYIDMLVECNYVKKYINHKKDN